LKKWNLLVDVALCENCALCVLAAKDEYVGNEFPGYSAAQPELGHNWIDIKRRIRGETPMVDAAYLPVTCNQCSNAPCVKAGGGAVTKRDDGIVLIDPVAAKGRKDIVSSCPYGAIWWNEEKQLPQKWTFDAHLLDQGWDNPRCVQSCPTGALSAVKVTDSEMAEIEKQDALKVLKPELGAKPRVYYKNLYRFTHAFIGGSVVADEEGEVNCQEGAKVVLYRDGAEIAETTTDAFGDFRFDQLECNSGIYKVSISQEGFEVCTRDAEVGESVYLGVIKLDSNSLNSG